MCIKNVNNYRKKVYMEAMTTGRLRITAPKDAPSIDGIGCME